MEVEVALYVRSLAEAELPGAAANLRTLVKQLQENLGLSLPGLARFRWKIVDFSSAATASPIPKSPAARPVQSRPSSRDRFKIVPPPQDAYPRREAVYTVASPEFPPIDFPTLGFLIIDWIEAHCVIPDSFSKGQPFILSGWQAWNILNHYRVKRTALGVRANQYASAFAYRRSQTVRPQKSGKGPFTFLRRLRRGGRAGTSRRLGDRRRGLRLPRLGMRVRVHLPVQRRRADGHALADPAHSDHRDERGADG
ncbi:hypothetical protein [Amycolatopsis sp. WAC 04182]|uniref:hypothetical protein n=1 Tax=Amycolatopsis sp. WAC 04182 TaxID=2203198 RepID=UPI0018F4F8D0|nr:hypothetical protein [Amycolatopsis sp. WAC 04182]